jgi:hypothetical protein
MFSTRQRSGLPMGKRASGPLSQQENVMAKIALFLGTKLFHMIWSFLGFGDNNTHPQIPVIWTEHFHGLSGNDDNRNSHLPEIRENGTPKTGTPVSRVPEYCVNIPGIVANNGCRDNHRPGIRENGIPKTTIPFSPPPEHRVDIPGTANITRNRGSRLLGIRENGTPKPINPIATSFGRL